MNAKSDGESSTTTEAGSLRKPRPAWWLDALLLVLLFLMAIPVRYAHTQGDLWSDEADYALASTHAAADQRWDRSDVAGDPARLVRSRHFHPPMTAYLLRTAQLRGRDERTLRMPFVLAGSLVVCLVYLCGLRLFDGRRAISLACAVIVLVTPLQVRAASHAIPWSLITLGLMGVLYTLLSYIATKRPAWLIGTCGVFGWLFCTTESFFPILLAALLSLPFVLGREVPASEESRAERRLLWKTLGLGMALFALIVSLLWPVGIVGGAWRNIQHYAHLPPTSAAAMIGNVMYSPVPRWAYLYWYSHDYKPYFALYVLGAGTLLWQIARRKLSRGAGVLLVLTFLEIAAAHATIILGPQYLAHCLPLLTLMTGFFFVEMSLVGNRYIKYRLARPAANRPIEELDVPSSVEKSGEIRTALPAVTMESRVGTIAGWMVLGLLCLYLARWHVRQELRVTDEEAMVSRWPDAAQFLAQRWQPGDRLLIGPQPTVVPKWYLLHYASLPAKENQISELPQGQSRGPGLARMAKGAIRFAVVNSTFAGDPPIDAGVRQILAAWPVVYRSRELNAAAPRLVIYEQPNR